MELDRTRAAFVRWMEPWRRARRPLARALKIVLAVAVVYEAAINVLLATGALGRLLSRDPESLRVEYASAWSIFPGSVHARDLRIVSKDSRLEMELTIDRCVLRVALLELLSRRLDVTYVHGEGGGFRLRHRLEPAKATPSRIEALPPIAGLEHVPIAGPHSPPPDDAHYKLWTVALDDVRAEHVREIWIDEIRYRGDADVTGSFYLKPVRWVHVGPVVAEIHFGRVDAGPQNVAEALNGEIDCTIDGFDPRATEGRSVLRDLNARVALAGVLGDLAFANRWLKGTRTTFVAGRANSIVDVRMERGALAPLSRALFDARGVSLQVGRAILTGDVRLDARVDAKGERGAASLDVEARELRLADRRMPHAPLLAPRITAHASSEALDLSAHTLATHAVRIEVPSIRIPDARIVEAIAGPVQAIRVVAGAGTAAGWLAEEDGVVRGVSTIGIDRLGIGGRTAATGDLRGRVVLDRWDVASGAMSFGASRIDLTDVATSSGARGWWASLVLPSLSLRARKPASARARFELRARDTRPFSGVLADEHDLPRWAVPLLSSDDLRASGEVRSGPRSLEVRGLAARAGPFTVNLTASRRGERTNVVALVMQGRLAAGFETGSGVLRLQLGDAAHWYEERTRLVHGTPTARRAIRLPASAPAP